MLGALADWSASFEVTFKRGRPQSPGAPGLCPELTYGLTVVILNLGSVSETPGETGELPTARLHPDNHIGILGKGSQPQVSVASATVLGGSTAHQIEKHCLKAFSHPGFFLRS